jgi:hypothetical protein
MKVMRVIIFLVAAILSISSCKDENYGNLSKQNIEDIIKQVKPVIDSVYDTKLNLRVAFSPLLTSKDFVYTYDAKIYSYDSLLAMENELANIQQSESFSFSNEKFNVLSKDDVFATLAGTLVIYYKDGTKETDAAVETALIKKIDNRWRIVYIHETTRKI